MKRVSMFVVTDGRIGYLSETLESLQNNVQYQFIDKTIINDCPMPSTIESVNNLANFYGMSTIHHKEKRGFAGVYDTAWQNTPQSAEYVFSTEDDFVFNEKIDIASMIYVLEYNRNLVQVCLKRQAWNAQEKLAGGIIEQWPGEYEEHQSLDISWCEHRLFYSTNPNLTPKWVIDKRWPLLPKSEEEFSKLLFRNPFYKSAFYGSKFEPPKVNHIGLNRVGTGY